MLIININEINLSFVKIQTKGHGMQEVVGSTPISST